MLLLDKYNLSWTWDQPGLMMMPRPANVTLSSRADPAMAVPYLAVPNKAAALQISTDARINNTPGWQLSEEYRHKWEPRLGRTERMSIFVGATGSTEDTIALLPSPAPSRNSGVTTLMRIYMQTTFDCGEERGRAMTDAWWRHTLPG